jgi:hypothetical protein
MGEDTSHQNGHGVYGLSHGYGTGVTGWCGDTPDGGAGVEAYGNGVGLYAYCMTPNRAAVNADGNLWCSGTKSFRIDHPDDPENKYLVHYCAEGPEPQNVYNGVVVLDGSGSARVTLPGYFAKINRDPRYSLTAIGAPMPMLYVARKIDAGAERSDFVIAGGAAGGEVSWEVKAVRNDAWVRAYGAPVEQEKTGAERGTYQHPELYGQPAEKGVYWGRMAELRGGAGR